MDVLQDGPIQQVISSLVTPLRAPPIVFLPHTLLKNNRWESISITINCVEVEDEFYADFEHLNYSISVLDNLNHTLGIDIMMNFEALGPDGDLF